MRDGPQPSAEHLPNRSDQPEPHEVVRIALDVGEHLGEHLPSSARVEPADQRGALGLVQLEQLVGMLQGGWTQEAVGSRYPALTCLPWVLGRMRTSSDVPPRLGSW